MNINEILNLATEGQRHWMEQQDWYKCPEFEGELHNAYPFLDIFESIPAVWDDRFIYDLLHDSTLVSEDRFIGIQSGLSLTDIEVDEIREKLVQGELEAFNGLEARQMEFEFFDETFIAVFVGGAERRCDWDPEFIGLYRSIEEAEKIQDSLLNANILRITPEMKAKVLEEGFPGFALGGEVSTKGIKALGLKGIVMPKEVDLGIGSIR